MPRASYAGRSVRTKITDLFMLIVISAMAVYLSRVGIDMHRRALKGGEIAFTIGVSATLQIIAATAALVLLRRR